MDLFRHHASSASFWCPNLSPIQTRSSHFQICNQSLSTTKLPCVVHAIVLLMMLIIQERNNKLIYLKLLFALRIATCHRMDVLASRIRKDIVIMYNGGIHDGIRGKQRCGCMQPARYLPSLCRQAD
jgi:hypothetical protein